MSDGTPTVSFSTKRVGSDIPTRGGRVRSDKRDRDWRTLSRLLLFAVGLMTFAIATVAVEGPTNDVTLQPGDIADRTFKANATTTFTSQLRTDERRQEAFNDERNVVTVFDDNVRLTQVAELRSSLERIDQLRSDRSLSTADKTAEIQVTLEDLTVEQASAIVDLSQSEWQRARAEAIRSLDQTLLDPISAEEIRLAKDALQASSSLSGEERDIAVALAQPFVRQNVTVDEERTQARREAAAAAVEPVMVTMLSGQALVRDGDVVTAYDIEKMQYLGLLSSDRRWGERLGAAGLMAILSAAMVGYIFRFHRPVWEGRQLLLLSLVVVGPLAMARLVLPHDQIQYMFPVAASAMLLAVLLDFPLSVLVSGILALMIGIMADMSLELVVLYFIGSAAGAFVIWRADRTITFVWSGVAVALSSFAVSISFNAINSELQGSVLGERLVESAVAGALAASLTFLSFSLLGSLFGITTHLQLLELAHPNQPLLYRLAREAPGTYHHSIVVSNLAESAVEEVGGDPLFTRVAVLYHDIGKIVRPTFFIENQANLENPHDLLDPRMSTRVIIDHVIDGARLARKARLPSAMIDIIQQHHGTSLIRYFYARTIEQGEEASEADFRYPGPKPQTKEAGIIMLADSTEAAVRAAAMGGKLAGSRGAPTDGSTTLESIVAKVIQERLDDGQLSECDLTLREISAIQRTFVQILEGIYHPRVDYPSFAPRKESPTNAPVASPAR